MFRKKSVNMLIPLIDNFTDPVELDSNYLWKCVSNFESSTHHHNAIQILGI